MSSGTPLRDSKRVGVVKLANTILGYVSGSDDLRRAG